MAFSSPLYTWFRKYELVFESVNVCAMPPWLSLIEEKLVRSTRSVVGGAVFFFVVISMFEFGEKPVRGAFRLKDNSVGDEYIAIVTGEFDRGPLPVPRFISNGAQRAALK